MRMHAQLTAAAVLHAASVNRYGAVAVADTLVRAKADIRGLRKVGARAHPDAF